MNGAKQLCAIFSILFLFFLIFGSQTSNQKHVRYHFSKLEESKVKLYKIKTHIVRILLRIKSNTL